MGTPPYLPCQVAHLPNWLKWYVRVRSPSASLSDLKLGNFAGGFLRDWRRGCLEPQGPRSPGLQFYQHHYFTGHNYEYLNTGTKVPPRNPQCALIPGKTDFLQSPWVPEPVPHKWSTGQMLPPAGLHLLSNRQKKKRPIWLNTLVHAVFSMHRHPPFYLILPNLYLQVDMKLPLKTILGIKENMRQEATRGKRTPLTSYSIDTPPHPPPYTNQNWVQCSLEEKSRITFIAHLLWVRHYILHYLIVVMISQDR